MLFSTEHQQNVEEFMVRARQETPTFPMMPSEEVRKLRAKLILEEALETIDALGFDVYLKRPEEASDAIFYDGLNFEPNSKQHLVGIVDGCCDVSVVTIGTLTACGVPDGPFLRLIDQNNLDKFGPGHSWREDGKLIKPEGHKPPDIVGMLSKVTNALQVMQSGR